MESRQTSLIFSWIFVFFNLFVSSGGNTESISLEKRLFVALAGTDLQITYQLSKPENQTGLFLVQFNNNASSSFPHVQINTVNPIFKGRVDLKNLQSSDSGEYQCSYKSARAYWFVLVRDVGYQERHQMSEFTEAITVGVFIFVLLVFSVVGSVYVLRGRWNEPNTEGGNSGRRREQSTEEQSNGKLEEDKTDAVTTPSSSLYASLELRPQSIYDVLDHSAANREAGQRKAKSKSKESHEAVEQTAQQQDGVLEFVYENF